MKKLNFYLSHILLISSFLVHAAVEKRSDQETSQPDKEYTFFKGEKTTIKNPFELRDPFKEEGMKRASNKKAIGNNSIAEGNLFSNVPTVESISSLDKIKVIGVLLGKDRRALVRLTGEKSNIIILREGMKVGIDNIELKAILPGGDVFVEKIKNVYDQDEYLETVIHVSSEKE